VLSPVVDNQGFVERWAEEFAEVLVGGMDEVGVTVLIGRECEKEAVSEALREIFGADVSAPLVSLDEINFRGEGAEGVFDLLDLFRRGGSLDFEEDHVAKKFLVAGGLRRENGRQEQGEQTGWNERLYEE